MGTRTDDRLSSLVNGQLSPEEALRVLDEVERDEEVSHDLDLHVELLNLARSSRENPFDTSSTDESALRRGGHYFARWLGSLFVGHRSLVPVGIAVACFLGVGALLTFRLVEASPYAGLAEIREPEIPIRVRSESDADLAVAAELLTAKKYVDAARRLERFLRMYPGNESVPWVEYAAGLARLAGARKTTWWIIVHFEKPEVETGLRHLQSVVEGRDIPGLREDALWYQAKGFLMIGNLEDAEQNLRRLVSLGSGRSVAAEQMLVDLRNLHHR